IISDYLAAKKLIKFNRYDINFFWRRKRHAWRWYRNMLKILILITYIALCFFSTSSLILGKSFMIQIFGSKGTSDALYFFITIYMLALGLPAAIFCLNRLAALSCAERLMKSKTTPKNK
ncbi:hypothetical protein, partial [Azohydromonas lata]|uniref:hypothetical protein n=1 Tax=Azohydromonas lata TaxID=45677 RepID=UPI001C3F45A2